MQYSTRVGVGLNYTVFSCFLRLCAIGKMTASADITAGPQGSMDEDNG